jgi:sec-independent protein translocase protein TatA
MHLKGDRAMFEGLLQPMHLLVILIIVLIIFGPGKLPQIGAGLGKSIREFKKAMSEIDKPQIEIEAKENKKPEPVQEEKKPV